MINLERYNRNILVDSVGEEGQKDLLSSRILIAGAGGLGSTVIANLAAVGIGTIGIVDNDKLELSNLNRQYIHKFENIGTSKVESAKEWISQFNPDINVKTYNLRLDENNYKDIVGEYDIIVDCFDSFNSKFLLNKICIEQNKPLIHGGVTEFFGQVMTIIPHQSACLACLIPDYDINTYVIKGVISPAVSTIASIQSMEAVKVILGIESSLVNELLTYDGKKQEFRKIKIHQNKDCPLCS
jgi:molybdopterin/thiamine biosynthesis adenylyltransferase